MSPIQFGLVLRGRGPQITVGGVHLEPYVAVPLGASKTALADGFGAANGYQEPTGGAGWHWGLGAGARLQLSQIRAVPIVELGWVKHTGAHDADGIDLDTEMAQVRLRLGVVWGL